MISMILIALACAVFFGVDAKTLKEMLAKVRGSADIRKLIASGLVVLALIVMWWPSPSGYEPTPEPESGPFSLRGVFLGETASDDASIVGALCEELADEIEYDGTQSQPYLKTGVSVDELRKAARTLRWINGGHSDSFPVAVDLIELISIPNR